MKPARTLVLSLFLALAACGGEPENAGDATAVAPPQPETATESEAPAMAEEPAADAVQPELVEESAADESAVQAADEPIVLAQAPAADAELDLKFTEGTHYVRMVPTQPTVGGADKIEVAEIFWYGCPHCYDLEPFLNKWKKDMPPNVRFVRIPAVWNPLVKLHAQLYYTEEVLAKNGKIADPEGFREAVFAEYHRRNNRLASVDAIQALFEKHGVSAEDFTSTWNSFEVAQKLRVAQDLTRRYNISGVPAIVVNGKYRTGAGEAGGYPRLLEVVNELIKRESAR